MTSNQKNTHEVSTDLALDDLADLCEQWKRIRQKCRTPWPLRSAILNAAQEAVDCGGEIKRLIAERDALRMQLSEHALADMARDADEKRIGVLTMTDIVERLNGFKSAAARSWAVEAANEIERLRAELEALRVREKMRAEGWTT